MEPTYYKSKHKQDCKGRTVGKIKNKRGEMTMKKIKVSKDKYTTYLHHSTENDVGGSFGTSDSGWSYKAGINYELRNVQVGEKYQVIKNGKLMGTFTK
jgi:hypothetical protein